MPRLMNLGLSNRELLGRFCTSILNNCENLGTDYGI